MIKPPGLTIYTPIDTPNPCDRRFMPLPINRPFGCLLDPNTNARIRAFPEALLGALRKVLVVYPAGRWTPAIRAQSYDQAGRIFRDTAKRPAGLNACGSSGA